MRVALNTLTWTAVLTLEACLPTAMTDAELAARVATTADAAAGADAGVPMCGNQAVESGESCDDGNQNSCDGCQACELRRAFDVADAQQFALAQSDAFNFLSNGSLDAVGKQISVSYWVKLRTLPAAGKPAWMMAIATEKYDPVFAMGAALSSGLAHPFCLLKASGADKTVASDAVLKPGEWHHLRCTLRVDKAKPQAQWHAYLSVDGQASGEAAFAAPTAAPKSPYLGVGAFPSSTVSSTFDGWLDELHVTTAAGESLHTQVLHRVPTADAGVALYHMDVREHDKKLRDVGPHNADAQQAAWKGGQGTAELKSTADDCYGYPSGDKCAGASTKPPWCP